MSDENLAITATAKLDQMKAIAFQHLGELDEEQTSFIAGIFEAGQLDYLAILKRLDPRGRRATLQLLHILAEATFMEYCVGVVRERAPEN